MMAAAARRRTWCGLLAAAVGLVGLTLTAGPGPAAAAPAKTGSAVTVSNPDGAFPDLEVTVAQTENLINQAVEVSWTGGTPTEPNGSKFERNYLQIMQCWGEAKEGPSREQCQYGSLGTADDRGGAWSATRQASYDLVDPLENEYVKPANTFEDVFVPFRSVTGVTTTGPRSEFFDANTTNQISLGRTRANATGQEFFEMQTLAQAPGLGCGEPTTTAGGDTVGRACWLVIVPRGSAEVDGSRPNLGLKTSPLSTTNWAQRLVVPLSFAPAGNACPFGEERRIVGQEPVVEAVSRWQPTLCNGGKGTAYGFSQVPDPVARRQAISPEPGLVLTSRPVPPELVPAEQPLVYAPVSLSGLAIGFLVERQTTSLEEKDLLQAGTRVDEIKLTPRLVAKLLTQSYTNAVPVGDPAVEGNPNSIASDPEFLEINPEFRVLTYTELSEALVPIGLSDAAAQLWTWIDADKDARAFLDGNADEAGMVVNTNFISLELPVEDFPKSDPFCQEFMTSVQGPLCALERRGYAADLHEAARLASRGDSLTRVEWNPETKTYRKAPPQPGGGRGVLAVTDTATAERYGIRPAKLRNAAGEFVAPTEKSLLASVAEAKPGAVKSVLEPNPTTVAKGAYPLTTLVYAATAPKALDKRAGREYATFLDYAVGKGQKPGVEPGTLPAGYVPLPEDLRKQTRELADQLRNPPKAETSPTPTRVPTSARPSASATRNGGVNGGGGNESGGSGGNTGGDSGDGTDGGASGDGGGDTTGDPAPDGTTTFDGTASGGTASDGASSDGTTSDGTTSDGTTSGGTTSDDSGLGGPGSTGTAPGGTGLAAGPGGTAPPDESPPPASVADPPASGAAASDPAVADPVAARSNTPGLAVGAVRFVFFSALLLGALAALAGPVLSRSSRAPEVKQSPPSA